jgi:hypothetical protein
VRIHRQKPKALGLKVGCGFAWHLSTKVLRPRDIDLLKVVPYLKRGTEELQPRQ